jgi:hypothetical protein
VIRSEPLTANPTTDIAHIIEERDTMASTTTTSSRLAHKRLKAKPKTESKSWQTRNAARKEKQTAHAAKLASEAGH